MINSDRQPQVLKQVDEVQSAIASLFATAEMLKTKLNVVMAPDAPTPSSASGPIGTGGCELADVLASKVVQLRNLETMLISINSRLEI